MKIKTSSRAPVQRRLAAAVALATLAQVPVAAPVYAQGAQLEEVLVTARQRSESVQDIPVSVSVMSGDEIAAMNLTTSNQLAQQTPNVVMVQGNFGLAAPIISIRGITNSNFTATSNSPVAFYADDVVINSIQTQGFALYDIDRVEMLRGPQGTLFGRNSTSGAISVHSTMPTEDLSGYARVGAGDSDMRRVEAAISGSLVESALLGRLSGVYNERDGLVRNTDLGQDEGEVDNYSVRGILQFTAIESLDATLKVQYAEGDGDSVVFHNSYGDNPYTQEIERGGEQEDYERIQLDLPSRYEELNATQVSLKLDYQLGDAMTLTSITGYMEHDFEHANDDDATSSPILHESSDTDQDQFTQEIRLNYVHDRMDWVVGAFYLDEDVDTWAAFENSHIFNIQGFPGRFGSAGGNESGLESWAVFSHLKYDLSDRWGLSAGVRYSEDERDLDLIVAGATSVIGEGPYGFIRMEDNVPLDPVTFEPVDWDTVQENKSWDEVSGDLGVQYHASDDVMLYAGYARGFKGGSFNTLVVSADDVVDVDPEIVDSFELGIKSQWRDNTLQLNAAAFYYDYQDFQAFEYVTVGFQVNSILFSIDEAESYGAEVELSWLPMENLGIDLGLGYTSTEVNDIGEAPFGVEVSEGNEFRNAPEWNFNGAIYYVWQLPGTGLNLTPMADFFYVDEYYSSFANEPESTAGDYWIFNAHLRLADNAERYSLTAWVENMFDDEALSGRFPANLPGYGSDFATAGPMRTYGVTLAYNF